MYMVSVRCNFPLSNFTKINSSTGWLLLSRCGANIDYTLITGTANYLNFHQIAGCGICGMHTFRSDQKPSTPRHPYNMNLWNIRNNPKSCVSHPVSSLSSVACRSGQSRLCIYGRCTFICEIHCVP